MGPGEIRSAYVLYIGAGAVAAGGIISLFRSLPTIWHGLKGGLQDLRGGQAATASAPRTDQDLSMKFVLGGIILLLATIMLFPQLHLQWNVPGAILIIAFGFLFVTVSSRLTGEIGSSSNPISGMTVATLLLTCLIFLIIGWTGPTYFVTALSIGAIVCIAASNGGTTSQDLKTGYLVGATPKYQQIAILIGAGASALILGPILLSLNNASTVYVPRTTFEPIKENVRQLDPAAASALPAYTEEAKPAGGGNFRALTVNPETPIEGLKAGQYLVDESGKVTHRVSNNFPSELRVSPSQFTGKESLQGPQASGDPAQYNVYQKSDTTGGPAGRYLVNDQGVPVYLVDPGINGTHKTIPGTTTEVTKFDAPKATLMSYIIKGVLDRKLPWGLVLLGVMIAIVLEMAGIPSLAFAVGVYLPLSSSAPIFVGGLVRWLVDLNLRKKLRHKNLTEEQLVAEGDKSPGVLMASGYIAGGAIAGIVIAFMQGVLTERTKGIEEWSKAHNPLFEGGYADILSMVPFLLLTLLLYMVGREMLLAGRPADAIAPPPPRFRE
jgi:hypothetical protein